MHNYPYTCIHAQFYYPTKERGYEYHTLQPTN